jgi:hypothetical protein
VHRAATVANFLRAVGAIYIAAFVSFGVQSPGLIGAHGILPMSAYLDAVHQAAGASRFWFAPTIFWISSADAMLAAVWIAGALCGVAALAGLRQRWMLAVCWVLWLSICSVGQDFLGFQWDMLLVETGFLSIFASDALLIVWLFRALVFRLMFLSGVVKLASGDLAWRTLTAMSYHYETQPLPTPLAWWMHQLPASAQRVSTAAVFAIELVAPLLFFAPRRLRLIGAWATIGLQVLILLTGNYAYFNWLTLALCLWLFIEPASRKITWPNAVLAIAIGALGLLTILATIGAPLPSLALRMMGQLEPLRLVNSYGLFAVMTTTRPEIILEGSNDGENWQAYEFRDKPGDLRRAPPIVAPHQPRLDWQMWFAALGSVEQNRWFVLFVEKLLRAEPAVLRLLAWDPFHGSPPKYIRARLFQYHFTRFGEPGWWRREEAGMYLGAVSLRTEPQP